MKYRIRQRIFSWFDSFDIYDEEGNTAFTVKGQLSWGHSFHFLDPNGNHIATVKEKVIRFLPTFEFYEHGEYQGELKRRFSLFHPQYDIDFNGWYVEGNFMQWNYEIMDRQGRHIASINKELFHLSDTYVIDVENEQDALCALMLVTAIDAEKCTASHAS